MAQGTSNFLQFNPNEANQETDSQFSTDALVTGGAPTDATLPSALFNKLMYQLSTFAKAFNGALAAKGYSPTDESLAQLQAIYMDVLTDADVVPSLIEMTYSPTMTFDGSVASGWQMTLFGNVTSVSIVNLKPGQVYRWTLVQDSVGGRTFTWPGNVATVGPQPDTRADYSSTISFLCGTDSNLRPASEMVVAPY